MTKEEKAYIAGFLDGEAYIGLMQRKYKNSSRDFLIKPTIKVAQLDQHRQVLEYLQSKYGGYISKTRQHKNTRDSVMWEVANKDKIKEILTDTLPYLKVKKEIAIVVIDFCSLPQLTNSKSEENEAVYQTQVFLQKKAANLTKRGLAETE